MKPLQPEGIQCSVAAHSATAIFEDYLITTYSVLLLYIYFRGFLPVGLTRSYPGTLIKRSPF